MLALRPATLAVPTLWVLVACGGSARSDVGSTNGGAAGAMDTGGGGGSANTGGLTASGGSTASSGGTAASGGSGGASSGGATDSTGGVTGTLKCATSRDCPADELCGFSEAAGCGAAAIGQCFPTPGATCNAYSAGCACDGSEINVVCTGLPDGYSSKPLAYRGACANTNDGGMGTTFSCGDNLKCSVATEYCNVTEGGVCCAPPNHSCMPIPAKCSGTPSCNCIQGETGATLCSDNGGVTVTFEYP